MVDEKTSPAECEATGRSVAMAPRVLFMLMLIVLPALGQLVLELGRGEKPGILGLFERLPSERHLRTVEGELESTSWWVGWARRYWARGIDAGLERGGRRVVFGRLDWLFYRPGVELVAGPDLRHRTLARRFPEAAERGDPSTAILDFHRQLAERGIELLLLPVPVKATAYPERLEAGVDPLSWPDNPGVAPLLEALRDAGVGVVDVDAVMRRAKAEGEVVFMPRDTHWTPLTMRRVAAATARAIRQNPGLDTALGPARNFDFRRVRFAGWGDLVGMLGHGPSGAADPGEGDTPPRAEGALFDAMGFDLEQALATEDGHRAIESSGSPVLLLGDSLTQVYSRGELDMGRGGGFGEHLARELGVPIEVIAQPAGGARRTRETLALAPHRLEGKRVVVWQLTRRDLLWGEWPRIEIPDLPTHPALPEAAAQEGVRRVVAWVVEASHLPRELDYRDCLTIVRYRQIEGDPVSPEGRGFFVAHQGWRDFAPTEAADYAEGDVHALELVPLPREHALDNSCWVDTLGLDRQPWWALRTEVRSGKNLVPSRGGDSDKNLASVLEAAREGAEVWRSWLGELEKLESQTTRGAGLTLGEGESRLLWDEALGREILRLGDQGEGPLAVIVHFAHQLAERGVELLLVPVPPRAAVVPELALGEGIPSSAGGDPLPRVDRWRLEILVALERRGIEVLDPLMLPGISGPAPSGELVDDGGTRGGQGFFRLQDPHWTHWGASRLAEALAERIRGRSWFAEASRSQGQATLVHRRSWGRQLGPFARRLARREGGAMPEGEEVFEHFTRVSGERWTFTDSGSPILLLGDSFTLREHGLPDALLRQLGFRPDQITAAGGLPVAPLEALALRQPDLSTTALGQKKLVIWALTSAAFHHLDRWHRVILPGGSNG